MPRASIVTPQAFARTARELLAQGRPVTNDAVVELTGGGSMATLVPLLRPWREDQKFAVNNPHPIDFKQKRWDFSRRRLQGFV